MCHNIFLFIFCLLFTNFSYFMEQENSKENKAKSIVGFFAALGEAQDYKEELLPKEFFYYCLTDNDVNKLYDKIGDLGENAKDFISFFNHIIKKYLHAFTTIKHPNKYISLLRESEIGKTICMLINSNSLSIKEEEILILM